jgi:hypothetical protein
MPAFMKHDRVEFSANNKVVYGTVRKSGTSMCEIVQDGAKSVFKVPNKLLAPSPSQLPELPKHPMDAWAINKYKSSKNSNRETQCFTAEITHNGETVIYAQNDGNGCCIRYFAINGQYTIVAQFEADAKQWLIDHGMPEDRAIEAGNIWLGWKVERAVYAGSAEDYVSEWKEALGIELDHADMKM